LYSRNTISGVANTTSLKGINSQRGNVMDLERENGNPNYYLPAPTTDMYGLLGKMENETKQTLVNVLGKYAPLFEGQAEDISEYTAMLLDALAAGKTVNLPRSAAQH
jgi:hypothetical protein